MGERLCLSRTSVYLFTLLDFFVLSGALRRLFIVYKRIRYLKFGEKGIARNALGENVGFQTK